MSLTMKVDPEQMLPEVQDMLYKLAWDATRLRGIPFEETLTEAYWQFMHACKLYGQVRTRGKNKGTVATNTKFSTFCHFVVENNLKTMSTKQFRLQFAEGTELNETITEGLTARPHRSPALEAMDELSGDAREMVALLLETPGDLFGIDITSPGKLLSKVKAYMMKHSGKSKQEVEQTHQEIATVFRRVWADA